MDTRAGFVALLRRVNLRHLTGRRLRALLTISGIAAGVALAFSVSVINATLLSSFRASIRELAGAAEIEVAAAAQTGLPSDVVAEIEGLEGVERAVPVLRSISRVAGAEGSDRILVLGVTPEITSLFPTSSSPFTDFRVTGGVGLVSGGLLLSSQVADAVGVSPGGSIRVETPTGEAALTVVGLVQGRTVSLLNGGDVGVMTLEAAQETFSKTGRVDSIYVVVDTTYSVSSVEDRIEDRLGGSAVVGPPGERGEGLERVFAGLGTLLSLTGTVSLFVALFVVYNTMSISLAERRKEISMALALGASSRQMMGAFLAEAAVLGAVASALGVGGGLLLARALVEPAVEAYRILPLTGSGPLVVGSGRVLLAAGAGILVSLAGAFLPARRVMSVAPIESLRPEPAYEWRRTAFLGVGPRLGLVIGASCLAASVLLVTAFVLWSEQGWIANIGLISGLTGITFLLPRVVPWGVAVVRVLLVRGFGTTGRLAADALARNPGRTTVTVAALVLSLAVAVGAGTALGSYERQVDATASALVGADLYVAAESYSGFTSDQPLPIALRQDLEAVEGVRYVYPLRFALVNIGDQQGLIYAVPAKEVLAKGATTDVGAITSDPQAFLDGLEAGGVAISPGTAERHDLAVGDSISLPTPTGERSFEVAALFNDLISFDSLYMDYETYTRLWEDDKADEFGVLFEDGVDLETARERIADVVRAKGVAANVFTQEELVGRILEIVEGSLSLGRGIQLAALVVAAVTIANTMFTVVLERRWETGLQRALGMGGRQVARMILLEASAIGLIGGLGGAILGTANGYLMIQVMEAQFAWSIAFNPSVLLLVLAVGGGTILAAVAGALPSRAAARAPIIESLRYE